MWKDSKKGWKSFVEDSICEPQCAGVAQRQFGTAEESAVRNCMETSIGYGEQKCKSGLKEEYKTYYSDEIDKLVDS